MLYWGEMDMVSGFIPIILMLQFLIMVVEIMGAVPLVQIMVEILQIRTIL